MNVIGVIPARYNSTRFKGKPLADICGKPMIWWVYQQARKVKELSNVFIATDDLKIENICKEFGMPVIMTSDNHNTPLDRIHEFSTKIKADLYVCINGDEPLIQPETIQSIIPSSETISNTHVSNLITTIKNPAEVIDFTNLKIVKNKKNECIYISRSPIPYPKGSIDFTYKKYVGVTALTSEALNFYVETPRGELESIEDNDLLRFIENNLKVQLVDVDCEILSVDTPKDLEKVRAIIQKRL